MFIEIEVKSSIIIHGYDNENKEIEELAKSVSEKGKPIAAICAALCHGHQMPVNQPILEALSPDRFRTT